MTVRKVTIDGRQYVMIPRRQWDAIAHNTSTRREALHKTPSPSADGSYTLNDVRISLANKIISRRKSAGLTQARLAKLAGVRVETISRLENGLHMPSVRTFDKIEHVLKRAAKRPAA
jgi:DNA-binding XRE family transcriptional regulator